jgi:type II secretory pathway component PulJ
MEVLSTVVNAVVIGAVGLLLAWQMRGQLAFIKERMDAFEKRMDSFERRMDGFDRRLDSFQASLESMRSDLTQVALAVGARPRAGEV